MNVHGRDGLGTALVLNVGNSEKEGEKNTFSKVSALVYVLCKPTRREFFFLEKTHSQSALVYVLCKATRREFLCVCVKNMCLCVGNIEYNLVPPPDKPA